MTRTIEDYMRMPYKTIVFVDNANGRPCVVAENPELPGLIAQGANATEAIRSLTAARREYIQFLIEDGLDVPVPEYERPFYEFGEVRLAVEKPTEEIPIINIPELMRV